MGYFVTLKYNGWANVDTHGASIEKWKLGGYMSARDNGVGVIKADRWNLGYWETFGINVIGDGPLVHGAEIILRSNGDPPTNKPGAWVGVRQTGGRFLYAEDNIEHFNILRVGGETGQPLHQTDLVFLVTSSGHRVTKTTESGPVEAVDDYRHSEWELKILSGP